MTLDLNTIRKQFPSLGRQHPAVFFDNPGGTQIARPSLDRINRYLLECNANHEGMFETSMKSDEILHEAHAAMADFLNACREGRKETAASFDYGARLTEFTLLGNLAQHAGAGQKVEWDGKNMKVNDITGKTWTVPILRQKEASGTGK